MLKMIYILNPTVLVLAMSWFLVSGQEISVLSSENYYGEESAAKLTNPEIKFVSKGRKISQNALKYISILGLQYLLQVSVQTN